MSALVRDSRRTAPARLAGSAVLACQSDDHLVRLVRDGHERAFDAIVGRYRKQLVRFSSRFLPESRTEDAVQQAFMNAHAALVGSDDGIQLKPWLYAITRNAALNMVRQNGWNYEQIPLDFDGVRRPDQVVEQRIQLQSTVAAMRELPERQRDALVMREFEGRSYEEIAVALGANDGAVRQLLNRARATLRAVATAVTPPPLVARAAASLPPSDGRRVAEIFGGLGAAGIAKAGATAVVAGSLVVGAIKAPLPLFSHDVSRQRATLAVAPAHHARSRAARASATAGVLAVSDHAASTARPAHAPRIAQRAVPHRGAPLEHNSLRQPSHFADGHRSDGGDGSGQPTRSGSGDHRSGSDDGGRTGTRSGTDDSGRSGSGTSGSGTSGSGSDGSGSGTSGDGSGDSLTVTGGDGSSSTSTSGSSDGGSTGTSGTSGSGDGGSSGTSTSGTTSPSSGSGSTDGTSGSTSTTDH